MFDQEELISLLNSLLRLLACVEPNYAEEFWSPPFVAAQDRPLGKWVEIRDPRGSWWYFVGKDRSGRFSKVAPHGVPKADIYVVEVPPRPAGNFALRHCYEWLAANVSDSKIRQAFEDRVPLLYEMTDPSFESTEVNKFLQAVRQRLLTRPRPPTKEELKSFFNRYLADLTTRFLGYTCPGTFLAMLLILGKAWQEAAEPFLAVSIKAVQVPVSTARDFVTDVLSLIVRKEGPSRVESVAKQLFRAGREFQRAALVTDNHGIFYGNLFTSCPTLLGALWVYKFLGTVPGLDKGQYEGYSRDANSTDEKFVRAANALHMDFVNRYTGGKLARLHREQVAEARKIGGADGAVREVENLLTVNMRYPKTYRSYLLGKGDSVP